MTDKADKIFLNGKIFTSDESGTICEALAIKDGRIISVGTRAKVLKHQGTQTELVNLAGNTMIPGLIDSHMHPLWGAKMLQTHSLNYEPLSIEDTLSKLEDFLKEDTTEEEWLKVSGWRRMGGSDILAIDLDLLPTKRPIMLFSNDCHFMALNSKGLKLLGIDENTPNPPDGTIIRNSDKVPLGIIEDAPAMRYYDSITQSYGKEAYHIFKQTFEALHAQGVTTIMDARALDETFECIKFMRENGALTLRFLGAREIKAADCPTPEHAEQAVLIAKQFIQKYDEKLITPSPGIHIKHLKFFIDGMPKNLTAYLQAPFYVNQGTYDAPLWIQGNWAGQPYFSEQKLEALFIVAAKHNLYPHCHIIGDGAAAISLMAIEAMRKAYPDKDIRPALAHLDIVTKDIYKKAADCRAICVLSFQWCGQPKELIEYQRNLFGPERYEGLETHGKFIDAGAIVAYGSDWPIEPLDEWGNFQVGLTRRMIGEKPDSFERLDNDRDLTLDEVLRAGTICAAYALGLEKELGSLEPGKIADMAIIKGDLFSVKPWEISKTKVLQTIVGGKTVYATK
ncbi:MAG: amidohydrolase family protein [Deltaproteobacteria bacterium]|jgi:predicted amidohydrolase YtcJ|nr:amidohydrolase family protein [Deltaproteobacteria bacterium]